MWKKIGIKHEKEDISVSSSQKGYKRVRQLDENSNCSGRGPFNALRKNNSENKFEVFVQLNKIQNTNHMKMEQKIKNNNTLDRSPYLNVERRRTSNLDGINNNKSERFSAGKSVYNEIMSVEQNNPSMYKNQLGHIVNEVIQNKQQSNNYNGQTQRKILLTLMNQMTSNIENNGKFDISSISSEKKLVYGREKNQYVEHLEEKVKILRKIKEIYQLELTRLRIFHCELLEFTRSELKKYDYLFETFKNQIFLLIFMKPKSEEMDSKVKIREKEIQTRIRKIEMREEELTHQEKIFEIKKLDLDKQQDMMNLRFTELTHKQQLMNQHEQMILTEQDLKQKKKNIQQQQKNLLDRLKQLEIKEQMLISKEKLIEKKNDNRIKSKEQENILIRENNKVNLKQNPAHKPSMKLQTSKHVQQKKPHESVNTLLKTINAMKHNLDEISGFNQKIFSKTLEKSRSQNFLLSNLLKMENEKLG